eukprot:35252-Chlamydomonas_euryale.AAC.5
MAARVFEGCLSTGSWCQQCAGGIGVACKHEAVQTSCLALSNGLFRRDGRFAPTFVHAFALARAGLLERAARCYERATSAISYDKTFPDEAKAAARDVRKACHLNLAAVRTRQARWGDVIDSCNKVLEADPDNLKALFRRAQGFLGQQDFLEAELDIKRGLCIEPESPDLLSLSKRLKAAQKALNKKESALYGKMFSKPAAAVPPAPAGNTDTKQAPDADAPVEQPAAA